MGVLKSLKNRIVPRALRQEVVALREVLADGWRYQRAAGSSAKWSDGALAADRHEARLTMDYHRVEKSLSLRQPRRPFGVAVRERIVALLAEHPYRGAEPRYVSLAEEALDALDLWNEGGVIITEASPEWTPQAIPLTEAQAVEFFSSRHSVRNLATERVPSDDEIRRVVSLARNTPSVCNRQGFRLHVYRDRGEIDAILKIQNGAVGFAETVPALGVVTARRALFVGPDERNQRWIDGGLFAMTLVWASHAVGLSTCMLNWALPGVSSAKLRAVGGIPEGEDIVVLIALGFPAAGARVARSEKRSVDDLAKFHS